MQLYSSELLDKGTCQAMPYRRRNRFFTHVNNRSILFPRCSVVVVIGHQLIWEKQLLSCSVWLLCDASLGFLLKHTRLTIGKGAFTNFVSMHRIAASQHIKCCVCRLCHLLLVQINNITLQTILFVWSCFVVDLYYRK